jgi:hypothetical protein
MYSQLLLLLLLLPAFVFFWGLGVGNLCGLLATSSAVFIQAGLRHAQLAASPPPGRPLGREGPPVFAGGRTTAAVPVQVTRCLVS